MKKVIMVIVLILLFAFSSLVFVYSSFLQAVSKDDTLKNITIEKNMTTKEIGNLLYENKLIKNSSFFVFYAKLNHVNNLKAGNYELSSNMNLKKIVEIIQKGNNSNNESIRITFKEGINYREMAKVIASNTNNSYDDVLNILQDKNYLQSLIDDYWFITEDILDEDIYYPLEGYLFPDTYEFSNKNVQVTEILKKLLDQMDNILSSYKNAIQNNKYSVHELLTLASMAEKEVTNTISEPNNRKKVVSVFINRLNKKMSLGSDITTRYGLKLDDSRALTKSEYNTVNAYNTRNTNMLGLPASPICMISKSSIEASIYPEETKYLYFIANIDTKETFFYEKSSDFEAKKKELAKTNQGY